LYFTSDIGTQIPDSISFSRNPTDSNSFFALAGKYDTRFNNKLYHFTLSSPGWETLIEDTINDETNQSLAVLKSSVLALVFVSDSVSTKLILREPEEAGSILEKTEIVNSGSTKPFIKALSDGGFVVIYLNEGSVYY